jgi:hypothetical protein
VQLLRVLASGLQAGYATIDSIRAVLYSGNFTDLSRSPTTTVYGFSGGSISAAWVSLRKVTKVRI